MIIVPKPGSGGGGVTLSGYTPLQFSLSASAASSFNPASYQHGPVIFPNPVSFNYVNMALSFNVGPPTATSANSSGSVAYFYSHSAYLWSRNGTGASSTQLSSMASGSFGLTATVSWSSGSQSFGMSWVTNSTGGNSTFSTTSSDAAWSSYMTGMKRMAVPVVGSLAAGEYLFMNGRASAASTSGQSTVLLSNSVLYINDGTASIGVFGGAGQVSNSGVHGGMIPGQIGTGAFTTNATAPQSALTYAAGRQVWFQVSVN